MSSSHLCPTDPCENHFYIPFIPCISVTTSLPTIISSEWSEICQVLIHVLRTHVRIIFISSFISRSFIVLRSSVSMSLYLQWMIINRYVKFSSMSYGPTWELFSYPVSIPLYLQWMTFISYGVHYQYQRSEIRDQRSENRVHR